MILVTGLRHGEGLEELRAPSPPPRVLHDDPRTPPGAGPVGDLNPVSTVTWRGAGEEERDGVTDRQKLGQEKESARNRHRVRK